MEAAAEALQLEAADAPKLERVRVAVRATQAEVYRDLASDIVESVMEGFNGTIFAYGQTGTGKTYTMFGGEGEEKGITPRAFSAIFNSIQEASDMTFLVRASFLELYNEETLMLN
ncbi:hypothetical protein ENH_00083820 [Eimeria necatrix]|uniref:Kinesin motor domain-containing protein n=1 Tax=Eimeria necatrix TaxID=51315 RepID=U6N2L0_9EIME|nr:hypothetical protein ENH_00083820 [Eimeria necatrix]CDJ70462.1 hypothetical protein ENH_00083820 [Eimeria necatrix]